MRPKRSRTVNAAWRSVVGYGIGKLDRYGNHL
jgi:hypothetical protein